MLLEGAQYNVTLKFGCIFVGNEDAISFQIEWYANLVTRYWELRLLNIRLCVDCHLEVKLWNGVKNLRIPSLL